MMTESEERYAPEREDNNPITIYLAGAIDHVSPEYALDWRKEAKRQFIEAGFKVNDPTDKKPLERSDISTYYSPEFIVTSDLDSIMQSDILFVEMARKDIPYVGTSMEIRQSFIWGKNIIVWGGPISYWVRYHADYIADEMQEAIDYTIKNFSRRLYGM